MTTQIDEIQPLSHLFQIFIYKFHE